MDQRHAFNVVKAGEFPATDLAACALLELIERHDKLCQAVMMMLTDRPAPEGNQSYRELLREKVGEAWGIEP
jgi:hypothetical protein